LEEKEVKYIINCKETSHKTLYEFVNNLENKTYEYYDNVNGFKEPKKHTINWLNNLPLAEQIDSARVNWFSLAIEGVRKSKEEVKNENDENAIKGKKKVKKQFISVYKDLNFSFVTNFTIDESNTIELTKIGRSRWKIENNNFNVLKNHGYHLEHNFGHGNKYLANTLASLNILSFLFHVVLGLIDTNWQLAFSKYRSRVKFFCALNIVLQLYIFQSFTQLFEYLSNGESRAPPSFEVQPS
jgi:hypothetical protein